MISGHDVKTYPLAFRATVLLALLAAVALPGASFANEPAAWRPWKAWRPGDMWKLKVVTYPAKGQNKEPVSTDLKVLVLASEDLYFPVGARRDRIGCWKLEFFPWKDSQHTTGDGTFLSIDEITGLPRKVVRFEGTPATVKSVGKYFWVVGAPDGLPLEFFPPQMSAEAKEQADQQLVVTSNLSAHETVVTATFRTGELGPIQVVQKWRSNEKWWREYEKYVDGRKVLSATRVLPDSCAAPKITIKPDAWKADPRYLRYDPRLHPRVSVMEDNPGIPALCKRMHDSTGLTFEVAENLRDHQPRLGALKLPEVRTFVLMEFIAGKYMLEGRWDQTDTGYRLVGTSTAPVVAAPASGTSPKSQADDEATPESKRPWWLWAISLTALAAIGFTLAAVQWKAKAKTK